ncbi:hypothetical protein GF325_14115 [Candidatus Bathyarchaeota archaeon]|nr:hypothetical protein [Candidatus Bathyarchaeota archaeon]
MVKVPTGARVTVDLWSKNKGKGMVKYHADTMFLVRGESDFPLEKGVPAIVVESHENFVRIIPLDDYTRILGKNLTGINIEALSKVIYEYLKKHIDHTGGMVSVDDMLVMLKKTSIAMEIKRKHLLKAAGAGKYQVQLYEHGGIMFLALSEQECTTDQATILELAKGRDYLGMVEIRAVTGWKDARIVRVMDFLVERNACRKSSTYKDGMRFYFTP